MAWEHLLEYCADMFGVTRKSKLWLLLLVTLVVLVLAAVLAMRWGFWAFVKGTALLLLVAMPARGVTVARKALWRSACMSLEDSEQRPTGAGAHFLAPTARTLHLLAEAVDSVRRADYQAANERLPLIERGLLRSEEAQLLDATRAMILVGLGSSHRAAQQAISVLPTGSDDLDACLGRTLVADAWYHPVRLRAIAEAWADAGICAGPLDRLRRLMRLRMEEGAIAALSVAEARELSSEARIIGDEAMASELEARSRLSAYR